MRTMEQVLTDMHRIIDPGEYGLGSEPASFADNDVEAWTRLRQLVDEAFEVLHANQE